MPPRLRAFLLLLLLNVALWIQTGCAETDADLDYQRDKPATTANDNSYHGWNSANN